MRTIERKPRLWSAQEYHQMVDLGFFDGQRAELIEGEIVDMAPQLDRHYVAVCLVTEALGAIFREGYHVRPQGPLRLGRKSEPEPDVAVVKGNLRSHIGRGHPTSAVLVVEVSDSSLGYDRSDKASLYAKHGIRDYWIVNLVDNVVEVHRDPVTDTDAGFGWSYSNRQTVKSGESLSPLAKPRSSVRVDDLLPRLG
ncbi:MAG: Uma2 family endonuclease [Tepidisphaerales bacterium]